MAEKSFFDKLTGSLKEKSEEPLSVEAEEKEDSEGLKSGGREEKTGGGPSAEEGQLTIDVYQTDIDIVIRSTIAGVKSEDIDIDITSDMVTIRGKRILDQQIPDEDYFYRECYWGVFSRSIILPQDIVPDRAEASLKNGILTIRLPKANVVKTKKLKVKAEA